MKIKYKETNPLWNTKKQILINRGITGENIDHYLHTTDDDILSYSAFGEATLQNAAIALLTAIVNNSSMLVI